MSEIKPMNLSGVAYNPMNSSAARGDIAKNVMDAERLQLQREQVQNQKNRTQQQILMQQAQLKMAKTNQRYNKIRLDRAEEDYAKKKKAENFMFANYPRMGQKTMEDFMSDGFEYGQGGYNKARDRWIKSVGPHSWQSFEAHYAASKKYELQNFQNAMKWDGYTGTESQHYANIRKMLNGMDATTKQQFLNSMDANTRQVFQSNFPKYKTLGDRFEDTKTDLGIWADDNPIKTGLGSSAIALGILGLTKFGAGRMIGKMASLWKNYGKVDDIASLPAPLKRAAIRVAKEGEIGSLKPGSNIVPADQLDFMIKKGYITPAQKKILNEGGTVIPNAYKTKDVNTWNIATKQPDILDHNNVKYFNKDLNGMVKDGSLSQSNADKLRGVVDSIIKEGDEITGATIGKKINTDKFKDLRKQLQRAGESVGSIGGLGIAGIVGSVGIGALAQNTGEMFGDDEGRVTSEELGQVAFAGTSLATAGALEGNLPQNIAKAFRKHGAKEITKRLATKMGAKRAALLVAKLTAGGVASALTGPAAGLSMAMLSKVLMAGDIAYLAYTMSQLAYED